MKELVGGTLTLLIIAGVIYGSFKIEQYRFTDCKKVGHGTLYCIMNIRK